MAVPTIAQTKARNIAPPTPDKNKEAPKAIQDRPTPDVRPGVQQTLTKGMKGTHAKDVYMAKKGTGTDSRLLEGRASPFPGSSVPYVGDFLKLTSLIPKGESSQKTPYEELDAAAPSSASSRGGASSYSNLFRREHWRGLRHKKTRPEAPRLDAPQESATQESSASSDWMGWRDWSGRKK